MTTALPSLGESVDSSAVRPLICALQLAHAAARAAQLRIGPDTSGPVEAVLDEAEATLEALLYRLRHVSGAFVVAHRGISLGAPRAAASPDFDYRQ